jgi:DNA-binding NarL/FixJ family response regulator
MDIGMPRLNGPEALRRLKAQRPDLAVLVQYALREGYLTPESGVV